VPPQTCLDTPLLPCFTYVESLECPSSMPARRPLAETRAAFQGSEIGVWMAKS
jgi:hypothetical protein